MNTSDVLFAKFAKYDQDLASIPSTNSVELSEICIRISSKSRSKGHKCSRWGEVLEPVPWHEGSLGGKWAAQVTPRQFSVRKACSWTPPPLGSILTYFWRCRVSFLFFFKRHPERHYVDLCSICVPFLDNLFDVFGAGSLE